MMPDRPNPAADSQEDLLAGQYRFHHALLEAQSDAGIGMFLIEQRRIVFANEAVCRLFGYTAAEILALPSFLELAHPDDHERLVANHRRRLAGEEFEHRYDVSIVTKAGERREAEITIATLPSASGLAILVIVVDISERKRMEGEIRSLNAELEHRVRQRTAELTQANQELESFAYSISHDLRAPLRGIDGFSRLLQEEYGAGLDDQGQEYLFRVRRAAQRLGTLIDDLLELSRVARQEMRRERVNLSRMAEDILAEMRESEPERPLGLSVAAGCEADGDPRLLRVLMENLLDNAWKYTAKTPLAQIAFEVKVSGGETAFQVRDNGVGFDMAYAGKLFVPFQRLHNPKDFEGSGIGLASCARVVRRHGGRIWAESDPGRETVFSFTLPVAAAAPSP